MAAPAHLAAESLPPRICPAPPVAARAPSAHWPCPGWRAWPGRPESRAPFAPRAILPTDRGGPPDIGNHCQSRAIVICARRAARRHPGARNAGGEHLGQHCVPTVVLICRHHPRDEVSQHGGLDASAAMGCSPSLKERKTSPTTIAAGWGATGGAAATASQVGRVSQPHQQRHVGGLDA